MLLEGSDIESLLAQVRSEYGSSARIVSADKVRTGGLGGFFAKEKYEISVEIDDDALAPGVVVAGGVVSGHGDAGEFIPGLANQNQHRDHPNHEEPDGGSVQALLEYADHREALLRQAAEALAAVQDGPSAPAGAAPAPTAPLRPALAARYAQSALPAGLTDPAPLTDPGPSAAGFQPAVPQPAVPHSAAPPVTAFQPADPPPAAAGSPSPGGPGGGPLPAVAAPLAAPQPEPLLPSTAGHDFADVLAGLRQTIGSTPAAPATSVRPFRPDPAADPFAAAPAPAAPGEDAFPAAAAVLAGDQPSAPGAHPPYRMPPDLRLAPPDQPGDPGHDAGRQTSAPQPRPSVAEQAMRQHPGPPHPPAGEPAHHGPAYAGYPHPTPPYGDRADLPGDSAEQRQARDEAAFRIAEAAAWARFQAAHEHEHPDTGDPHTGHVNTGHLNTGQVGAGQPQTGHADGEPHRPAVGRRIGTPNTSLGTDPSETGWPGPGAEPVSPGPVAGHRRTARPADHPGAVPPGLTTPSSTTTSSITTSPLAPGALIGELRALGVPGNLADRAVGRDPYTAIVRALGMLPAPATAPSRAGEILVIAGELHGSLDVARTAAKRLRIDPASILVAGPTLAGTGLHTSRRMSGPVEAAKRAARLHSSDTPHLVVVDAPIEGDNGTWAHAVAEELGASAVWALVDATRKTADVARHLRGLGIVDAIAVHGTAATADPASVLSLGVPVALLDGRRATPQAWAALLCDRLGGPAT
jgi:hypothetical protein